MSSKIEAFDRLKDDLPMYREWSWRLGVAYPEHCMLRSSLRMASHSLICHLLRLTQGGPEHVCWHCVGNDLGKTIDPDDGAESGLALILSMFDGVHLQHLKQIGKRCTGRQRSPCVQVRVSR
jgi:hypothetical protein